MDDRKAHSPREAELARGMSDGRNKRSQIDALVRAKGAAAIPELVEMMSNESWTLRDSASIALAGFGRGVVAQLLPQAESGLWYCRASVAHVLGGVGGPESIGPLLQMLGDSNRTVSTAGLDALAKICRRGGAASVARRLFALPPAGRNSLSELLDRAPGGLGEKLRQLMADGNLMAVREDADESWEAEGGSPRGSQGLEWEVLTGGKDKPRETPE